jgi:hypothetical protein
MYLFLTCLYNILKKFEVSAIGCWQASGSVTALCASTFPPVQMKQDQNKIGNRVDRIIK